MPTNKWSNAITIFSAVKCVNPFCPPPKRPKIAARKSTGGYAPRHLVPFPGPLRFSLFECETKTEHGDFNLGTGTFTVNKAGMFQFTFTGLVHVSNISPTHQFELMVDGNSESIAFLNLAGLEAMQPVVISALLQLKVGQKVSIMRVSGGLFQVPKTRCTCFSSSFFT